MKAHPQQVYSVPAKNYEKGVKLIITKASNGPIFQWGTWNGKKFNAFACSKFAYMCNSSEQALKLLNASQAA